LKGRKPFGNLLDSHAGAVFAVDIEGEYLTNNGGFIFLNLQLFLVPASEARLACIIGFVTIRRFGAIEVSLPRVVQPLKY